MRNVIITKEVEKYFRGLKEINSQRNFMSMLLINSQQTITEVQQQFNGMFPFLKIEFYREPVNGKIRKEKLTACDIKVADIPSAKKFGKMSFESDMTIEQIESLLRSKCGLNIQIFRKSGPIWLETTATSKWTLERQNLEGQTLEEHLKKGRSD